MMSSGTCTAMPAGSTTCIWFKACAEFPARASSERLTMRFAAIAIVIVLATASTAPAGPASGTVKSATGTISPKFATAFVVRDDRHPHETIVEVLLTDVAVD